MKHQASRLLKAVIDLPIGIGPKYVQAGLSFVSENRNDIEAVALEGTRPRFQTSGVRQSLPVDNEQLKDEHVERVVELLVTDYSATELAQAYISAMSGFLFSTLLTQVQERDKINANYRKGVL